MTIIERIAAHLLHPPKNEDGEDLGTKLLPALSAADVDALEMELGCSFSSEVKSLLRHCSGFEEGPMEIVDFKGQRDDYPYIKELNGRMRSISPDGFGNFWFYWMPWINQNLGPIFYFQHEGPMLIYQSNSLIDFVGECLRFMTPPYASQIDDVHEFRLKPIKQFNLDLVTHQQVQTHGDESLKSFTQSFSEDCLFYDFRSAKIGDGIDLSDLEIIKAHPHFPILAVKKRKSFAKAFSFLFGR